MYGLLALALPVFGCAAAVWFSMRVSSKKPPNVSLADQNDQSSLLRRQRHHGKRIGELREVVLSMRVQFVELELAATQEAMSNRRAQALTNARMGRIEELDEIVEFLSSEVERLEAQLGIAMSSLSSRLDTVERSHFALASSDDGVSSEFLGATYVLQVADEDAKAMLSAGSEGLILPRGLRIILPGGDSGSAWDGGSV